MKIYESYCAHLFGFSVLVRKDRIIITFFFNPVMTRLMKIRKREKLRDGVGSIECHIKSTVCCFARVEKMGLCLRLCS